MNMHKGGENTNIKIIILLAMFLVVVGLSTVAYADCSADGSICDDSNPTGAIPDESVVYVGDPVPDEPAPVEAEVFTEPVVADTTYTGVVSAPAESWSCSCDCSCNGNIDNGYESAVAAMVTVEYYPTPIVIDPVNDVNPDTEVANIE